MADAIDPALNKLEQQYAAKQTSKKTSAEEVYEVEETSEAAEHLENARGILRSTAILLEFLSNPDFCKGVTKRDRMLMERQTEQIWIQIDALEEAINDLEAEEDDEEEDE